MKENQNLIKENLNRVCLGCIYLNRACDGMTDPDAVQCKSDSPEARRQFAKRRLELITRGKINAMCMDCQHFRQACAGTDCQTWSGCILKDQPPEKAEAYIKSMTKEARK